MAIIKALRCERCGTFVRRWETWYDVSTAEHVFKAFCHGEIDECRIDFSGFEPRQIVEAVAFRSRKEIPYR